MSYFVIKKTARYRIMKKLYNNNQLIKKILLVDKLLYKFWYGSQNFFIYNKQIYQMSNIEL